jgi:AraC family ethanolamine operon transcriptional activator
MSNPTPASQILNQQFSDLDAFVETLGEWSLRFRQLDRGPTSIHLLNAACGPILIGYGRFNRRYEQRTISPLGMLTFALLNRWTTDVHWRDEELNDQSLLSFPLDREILGVTGPDFRVFTLTVSASLLIERSEELGCPEISELFIEDGNHFRITSPALHRLRSHLRTLCAHLMKNPTAPYSLCSVENVLLESLIAALASICPVENIARPRLRFVALSRAIDYVEGHPNSPLTVRELSKAALVSSRTLEYAFREYYGIGPKTYLLALRLDGARHELLAADHGSTTVQEVASRRGFWHMSQFALDYRRLFGDLPSDTLKRSPGTRQRG